MAPSKGLRGAALVEIGFEPREVAMISMKSSFGFAALAFSMSTATVRADMGAVWVQEVTGRSVTIDWSDPGESHRLASDIPLYRVSWARAEADERTLSQSARVLVGTSQKPYTFSNLEPGTYYRFRVETHSSVLDAHGSPINPKYRQVGTIRQGTAAQGGGPLLRLAGANDGSLQVEFTNPGPGDFQIIRLAYKARWKVEDLCAIARDPVGPQNVWVSSNESCGWVDVASASVLRESLPSQRDRLGTRLLKDTSYEIVAYGFNIGQPEGTRLGNVHGKTSGATRFDCIEKAAASDHTEIIVSYGRLVSFGHAKPVVEVIGEEHPRVLEARDVLISDREDLNVDFTALEYLIDGDTPTFVSWQTSLLVREEMTLERFVSEEYPDLATALRREVGLEIFQRGDASPNGVLDIADPVRILSFLFDQSRGAEVFCMDAADANDSSEVDMSDPVFLLNYLFATGPEPPSPHGACGPDLTGDELDCEYYASCPGPVISR
jgi:hypothetical protein